MTIQTISPVVGEATLTYNGMQVKHPLRLDEYYEMVVAHHVRGDRAVLQQAGYDVIAGGELTGKTIQVKYSRMGFFRGNNQGSIWTFNQSRWDDVHPDFFVLVGLAENGNEHWFAMTRSTYQRFASPTGKGGYLLQMYPYRHRSNSAWKNNKGWDCEIKGPHEIYDYLKRIADFNAASMQNTLDL